MGPAMTPRKPISSAISLYSTNCSGLTQRSIGWKSLDGRRYCVRVMMSQPESRRSHSAS